MLRLSQPHQHALCDSEFEPSDFLAVNIYRGAKNPASPTLTEQSASNELAKPSSPLASSERTFDLGIAREAGHGPQALHHWRP